MAALHKLFTPNNYYKNFLLYRLHLKVNGLLLTVLYKLKVLNLHQKRKKVILTVEFCDKGKHFANQAASTEN